MENGFIPETKTHVYTHYAREKFPIKDKYSKTDPFTPIIEKNK